MHHVLMTSGHIGSVRFLDLFFRNRFTISDVLAKMDSGGLFFVLTSLQDPCETLLCVKRIMLEYAFVTKKGIIALQQSLNTQMRSVSKLQGGHIHC